MKVHRPNQGFQRLNSKRKVSNTQNNNINNIKSLNSGILKKKRFILPFASLATITIFFQLLSKGIIFNDPQTALLRFFMPDKNTIQVPDKDQIFYFPPAERAYKKKINDLNIVVFGVNISWENACLGSQIIANLQGSPVLLIHNGSVNPTIDYIRAGLNRLHFWPFGLGHDLTIKALENTLYQLISQDVFPRLRVIGHSAGTSTIYSALEALNRHHLELKDKITKLINLELWGSPEFMANLDNLKKQYKARIYNRENDYIVEAFQRNLFGGLALPFAINRMIQTLKNYGNQHRAILYLKDYEKHLLTAST